MIGKILSVLAVYFIAAWIPTLAGSELMFAVFNVPGTFLHELAHYGFALLLNGNPGTFSVIPTYSGGEMQSLGHITFSPNWYNAATVCLSPLLVIPASIWLMLVGSRLNLFWNFACVYTAACGFSSSTPSSADWAIATSYPLSFVVAIPILLGSVIIWYRLIVSEIKRP